MKTRLLPLFLLTAFAVTTTFTSCTKEENVINEPDPVEPEFTATMEAYSDHQDKTILDGTTLNWQEYELIDIYGTEGSGTYQAVPQNPPTTANFFRVYGDAPGNAPFRAFFPEDLTWDGTSVYLNSFQYCWEDNEYRFPMYAESDNNQLAFKHLCGLLKLHLTKANVTIKTIVITASSVINGNYSVNYNAGNPQLIYMDGGSNTTTLQIIPARSISEGNDIFLYLPEGDYTDLQIELVAADESFCVKTANTTIPVRRSRYTSITLGENDLTFTPQPHHDNGVLPGLFSINPNGDQVRFSQGNLQYNTSTQIWSFTERQYSILGDYDRFTSTWIDLFGWGTGNNPTLTSTNPADYSTFVDWGVNAISNGGGVSNFWRTLSNTEWEYIINTRTDASAKRGLATVSGVPGMVLLPDNWAMPAGLTAFNTAQNNYRDNVYTVSLWAGMETAGAVFLPFSLFREGTEFRGNGLANYWSSTPSQEGEAYSMIFGNRYLSILNNDRYMGYMVRLVKDNQ